MSDQDLWRKDLPENWQGKQAETWDGEVPLKPIIWSTVAVVISVLVAFVLNAWFMSLWNDHRLTDVRQSPLAEARERAIAVSPKLQQDPEAELIQMKAEQKEHLASYGWVDAMDERVHIPVVRAMELVLEQKSATGTIEPAPGITGELPASGNGAATDDHSGDTSADESPAHESSAGVH